MDDVTIANETLASISDKYLDINSTDAQAYSHIVALRERRLKGGTWFDKDEKQFQYSQALDRQLMLGDGILSNLNYPKELQEHDRKLTEKGNPNSTYIYVEKPIVAGHTEIDGEFSPLTDKFSIVSFTYAAIRNTNFRDHYVKMLKQGIGYAVMSSGRKVGQTTPNTFYDKEGVVNDAPYIGITSVPFANFGVQTDTSNKKEKQTRGTQITKLIIVNLYDKGVPINEQAHKLAQQNLDLLREQTDIGYKKLLKNIGAEDNGKMYRITDKTKVLNLVKDELLRREVADNIKELLNIDENTKDLKIPFEALPNYIQIKNILYSFVDKYITHPKVSGAPKVQVSGALMEKYGVKRELYKGKAVYVAAGLKFYTKEEPWIEVLLPAWAGKKLRKLGLKWDTAEQLYELFKKSPDADRLLSAVGFRIPTQELNSVENIRIAGFLPEEFGDTIVVPEEITTKAGSDFDIDKLNTYLQNLYVDAKGEIRIVPYFGIGEGAKSKIRDLVRQDTLEKLFAPLTAKEKVEAFFNESPEDVDDIDPTKDEEYIDELYRQSIENEYFRNMQEILSLSENFERLVTPNTADTLKAIRDQLVDLSEVFDTSINPSILSPMYMLNTRHEALSIKDLVGIAAITQTGTAVSQLSQVVIDPKRLRTISPRDAKFLLNNAQPLLPHNQSDGKATISAIKDVEGNYVTDNNSEYINGTVDVFNDAFLVQLNYNRRTAGIYHLMVRLGIPNSIKHPIISFFMNQPIIRQHLNRLDTLGKNNIRDEHTLSLTRRQFSTNKTIYSFPKKLDELTEMLKASIKDAYNGNPLSVDQKAQQNLILKEFLKYATLADHLFGFQQATNYDTARMNDANSMYFKEEQKRLADTGNVWASADAYLDSTFIGDQRKALLSVGNTLSDVLPVQQEIIQEYLREILQRFALNRSLSLDRKNKVARQLEQSLFDYLIQTRTGLNNSLDLMLVNTETALVNRLREFKKNKPDDKDTIWGNVILQNLIPYIKGRSKDATKNITLAVKPKDVYSRNVYNAAFQELYDNTKTHDLARSLIKLSFLQSGVGASILSYKDYLPPSIYASTVNSIMEDIVDPAVLQGFVDTGAFYKNNWSNEDIVPIINSDRFPLSGYKPYSNFMSFLKDQNRVPKEAINPAAVWVSGRDSYSPFLTHIDYVEDGDNIIQIKRLFQRVQDSTGAAITQDIEIEDAPGETEKSTLFVSVSAWGDGYRAQEYYNHNRSSVFKNGYFNPKIEISPSEVYNYIKYGAAAIEETIKTEAPSEEAAPIEEPKIEEKPLVTEVTRASKKEKFTIKLANGSIGEREGYRLTIKEYPDFQGYVGSTGNTWFVTEVTTGGTLGIEGKTIKEVLEKMPAILNTIYSIPQNRKLLNTIGIFKQLDQFEWLKATLETKDCN